jgi:hypothetical protein
MKHTIDLLSKIRIHTLWLMCTIIWLILTIVALFTDGDYKQSLLIALVCLILDVLNNPKQ